MREEMKEPEYELLGPRTEEYPNGRYVTWDTVTRNECSFFLSLGLGYMVKVTDAAGVSCTFVS